MNWGFFNRKVPEWCTGFSGKEFIAFQSDFEKAAENLGYKFNIDWESGQYSEQGSNLTGGLMNLSQVWRNTPADQKVEKIESFLKILHKRFEGLGEQGPEPFDQDYLDQLRIRIYPIGYFDGLVDSVSYPIVPGFIAALVRDTPETVETVGKKELEDGGTSREAAYERAMKNVLRHEGAEVHRVPLPSGEVLNFVSSGSFYVATYCLALDHYLTQGTDAVFAVPNRHVLMFIQGNKLTDPSRKFLSLQAMKAYEDGPGSITTELFSWNSGSISGYIW